jgi:SOS-response transcriptional repressor LexA
MASPGPLPPSDDAQSSATTLGQRIRARRDAAGMTQEKLAAQCGVSRAAVAQWESGVTRPSLDNLVKVAEALNVWLSWLTVGDQSLPDTPNPFAPASPFRGIPVIDYGQASLWGVEGALPVDIGGEIIATDAETSQRAFALVIRDNSMAPDFSEGDKIILDPDLTPQPGDLVVAKLDSEPEATFKKFRPRGTDGSGTSPIELAPLNPDWPTLVINAENPGRIIATLVEQRRYRRRAPQT